MTMNMPAMPGLPGAKPESNSNPTEETVGLEVPSHIVEVTPDEGRPSIVTPDNTNHSAVIVPKVPKTGIEVVAIGKGFYNQRRITEGTPFKIKSEAEFGSWFKCVDPDLEKKRVELLAAKKARK
jgi:hypothetical protein